MFVRTDKALTIYDSQLKPHPFQLDNYDTDTIDTANELIREGRFDEVIDLLEPKQLVEALFVGADTIEIRDGVIWHNNEPLHNYAASKALQFARENLPYQPILAFIARCLQNPSYRVVETLYKFLEHGALPLSPDGHFMAYKKVRVAPDVPCDAEDPTSAKTFTDIHSGRTRMEIGSVVEMPRNQVDEDPDNTCSRGLHVCSYDYLESFGSGSADVVIAVKVDPADVVAIPRDYNDTKMRVCKYTVVSVVEKWKESNVLSEHAMYDATEDEDEDYEDYEDEDENFAY